MKFNIKHLSTYQFDKEVYLEPHRIRLHPATNACQTCQSCILQVTPQPTNITRHEDMFGNLVYLCWFSGEHASLSVEVSSEVDTHITNPFAFIVEPEGQTIPFMLSADDRTALKPYLSNGFHDLTEIRELTTILRKQAGDNSLDFIQHVTGYLYEHIRIIRRETGYPMPPRDVWNFRKGACRDVTQLLMTMCRMVGIPCRFVSGYQAKTDEEPPADLHAWLEVYIPGGGWRGYDATRGLAVSNEHVAVAAASTAQATLPVAGTYRGSDVHSKLEYSVQINHPAATHAV